MYHERRICFLQFPRCGRCRPYAALLWFALSCIYLICNPDGRSAGGRAEAVGLNRAGAADRHGSFIANPRAAATGDKRIPIQIKASATWRGDHIAPNEKDQQSSTDRTPIQLHYRDDDARRDLQPKLHRMLKSRRKDLVRSKPQRPGLRAGLWNTRKRRAGLNSARLLPQINTVHG